MKLYRTTYIDDADTDTPSKALWTGTQADTAKKRKELKADGMRDVESKEVDVPTDKQGLLAFLNAGD